MWHLFIQIMKYSLISRFLWISNNPNTDRQKKTKYWQKHIHVVVHVRPVRRRNPFYFFPRKKNIKTAESSACQVSLYWSCRALKTVHKYMQIRAWTNLNRRIQPLLKSVLVIYPPPPIQRHSSKTDNTCMMFILIDSKGACLKL